MINKDRKIIIYKLIYSLKFFSECLFLSYTGLFLLSLGFSKGSIGSINSLNSLVALIVNPMWALGLKNNKIRRIALPILSLAQGIAIIIYGNLTVLEAIMLVSALFSVTQSPYINILDSLCVSRCNEVGYEYSKVRIYGSITYLIGFLVGGYIIEALGYKETFMLSGSILILTSIIASFIGRDEKGSTEEDKKTNFKAIFQNKTYLIFIVCHILCFSISSVEDQFLAIYLQEIHSFTPKGFSYLSICIVVFEILTTFVAPFILKRFKSTTLVAISMLLLIFKTLGIVIPGLPIYVVLISQILRGVAVGIVSYNNIKYILALLGKENVASATIINGIFSSVVVIIFNFLVGHLLDQLGYNIVYLIMLLIMLPAFISYILVNKLMERKKATNI